MLAPVDVDAVPAEQPWQASSEDTPVTDENVPAGQLRQTDDTLAPTVVEYRPAEQPWQFVLLGEAEAVENVPAGQLLQAVAPWAEKVPAWHAVQDSGLVACVPKYPGLHWWAQSGKSVFE